MPNVLGLQRGAAASALRAAGFEVAVSYEAECDRLDPVCGYQRGKVWQESPDGGSTLAVGSTVTIVVNP